MDQQDGVERAWRWNLCTGKWVTRRRLELRPSEKSGVDDCFPAGFPPTCRLASCASEFEVASR